MVASLRPAESRQPAHRVALAVSLVLSVSNAHDVSHHAMAHYMPKVRAGTDASAPTSNGPRNLRFEMQSPPFPNWVTVPWTAKANMACHKEIMPRQCREGSCQCRAQIAKIATRARKRVSSGADSGISKAIMYSVLISYAGTGFDSCTLRGNGVWVEQRKS